MGSDVSEWCEARVPEEWGGERLDRFLSEYLALCNRSQLKSRGVETTVNGEEARLSRKLHPGELVRALLPPLQPTHLDPEEIELPILYEDDQVIVVNKPQGLIVHPGAGNPGGTLANALVYHSLELQTSFQEESEERPGIVHRLDKETSGVIITAKNPEALATLAREFKRRTTEKRYVALLRGTPPRSEGIVEGYIRRDPRNRKRFVWSPVEGKEAITGYKVLRHLPSGYTLVRFEPKTGRTHQLRVHAAYLHAPILGDPVYSRRDQRFPDARMMLHALSLRIRLPGEEEPRLFRAPLPPRFRSIVRSLRDDSHRETP
ncbi:MAG: RluA family pseudouridine synthase [Alkalispirochaetaceae bacterium]